MSQIFSFSNCNATVKITVCDDDEKTPMIIVRWEDVNGEQKWYDISTGTLISSCVLVNDKKKVTLSPNGRKIVFWYSIMEDILRRLRVLVIDTETQQLTEGTAEEFGEFIDTSSDKPHHGSCIIRILDNGLLHFTNGAPDSYENYIYDRVTGKTLDIEDLIVGQPGSFLFTIVVPHGLLVLSNVYGDEVLEYDAETEESKFITLSREQIRYFAEKYIMTPYSPRNW